MPIIEIMIVATTPTVYGIETMMLLIVSPPLTMWLQQHLPFTVLKRTITLFNFAVLLNEGCNNTYRLRY